MHLSLVQLREQTKASYALFFKDQNVSGVYSMTEKWRWAFSAYVRLADVREALRNDSLNGRTREFALAGASYYHAKKHGIDAAMMAKLQGTLLEELAVDLNLTWK